MHLLSMWPFFDVYPSVVYPLIFMCKHYFYYCGVHLSTLSLSQIHFMPGGGGAQWEKMVCDESRRKGGGVHRMMF